MPGLNGLDVVKRIRLSDQQIKIVVLSMHEENIFANEAMLVGANAYLVKSIESSDLIQALLSVCSGNQIFPRAEAALQFQSPLSDREHEILRLVSCGKTSDVIANELKISFLTVKAHRRNIMRKLNSRNTAELLKKAMQMGLL